MLIKLTPINETELWLNHRLFEKVTAHNDYDTVIFLTEGKKYIVKETPEQIKEKVLSYESEIIKRTKF